MINVFFLLMIIFFFVKMKKKFIFDKLKFIVIFIFYKCIYKKRIYMYMNIKQFIDVVDFLGYVSDSVRWVLGLVIFDLGN